MASDSFMVNLQSVLLRFSEPFMDARYSKVCVFCIIRLDIAPDGSIDGPH